MMPGENHSKAAGIASEAVGSCQNCTSLQQNLNEYLAALITLKQKIIDSDHLLAEYQRKCDDLQDAERENKVLRCQLEQMLQKISPWEQKEQLKSFSVKLEEKSTLDDIQQSQLEYVRAKEECRKCDMTKKKQAKLKKIEELASKHIQNVKQLQQEKRIIERKLKQIQKKLGDIQKKKTIKHAQTQVTNVQPVVTLDKKKIRILLEELWGCIESSTETSDGDKLILKTNLRKGKRFQSPEDCTPSFSHFSSATLSCNFEPLESTVEYTSNYPKFTRSNDILTCKDAFKHYTEDKAFHTETSVKDVFVLQGLNDSGSINSDYESDMEELLQIMNWAKPLPHLLSPLTFSPLSTKYMFGEFTDSSDNESSEGVHNIVENKGIGCSTLEKKIICVQDQTNFFPCPETENVTENCKLNVGFGRNVKNDSIPIVTDCNTSQSEFCNDYKGDHSTITEMETDKKAIEISPIQSETSFNVANKTLAKLTEQDPMKEENTLHSAASRANGFEESSISYPSLNVPVRKLSPIDNPEVELLTPSSNGSIGDMATTVEHLVGTDDFSGRLVIVDIHCYEEGGSSSAISNLPIHHNSSVNASKTIFSTDSPLHNCNIDEICPNEYESTKSLQVDNVTSAVENHVQNNIINVGESHVHDNIVGAGGNHVNDHITSDGENHLHDNIISAGGNHVNDNLTSNGEKHVNNNINTAGENHLHNKIISVGENHVNRNLSVDKYMEHFSLTDIDQGQDNLLSSAEHKICLNEFNYPFNDPKNFKDSKQLKSCFVDVDTGKSDNSASVNVEMCSDTETVQCTLDEIEEKSDYSSSTPIVQFERTMMANQYFSDKMDTVDPEYLQELVVQKQSISLGPLRSIAEDGHCQKAESNVLGYGMQDALAFMLASTEHTFQRDKAHTKSPLQLDSNTADKENNLSETFAGRDSICLSMEKLEDKSGRKMHSDLPTCAVKMEKTKQSKHDADESGSTSKRNNITKPCIINSSETVQLSSSNVNLCTLDPLKAQIAVVADVHPVIELEICSQSQAIDDQLCSVKYDQSHSTILLHANNTFPSNTDATSADGCLNKLQAKHIMNKKGMPLLSNEQLKVSMDFATESRGQLVTINKDLCKSVTPRKEFQVELDLALEKNTVYTLQSNNETLPMNFNQSKVMHVSPLEQQHLNIPSESSKALDKITEEIDGNRNACGVSLDSSEEDTFPIRKVSYSKVVCNTPVNVKKDCKSVPESIEDKVCNVHLELNDTPWKSVITQLADLECAGNLSANVFSENDSVSETENGNLVVHDSLVTVDLIVDPENDRNYTKNTVKQTSGEKETTTLKECENTKERLVSENIQHDNSNTGQNCCTTIENESRKPHPGKNFIWNFERPDDPIIISGNYNLKANVKMLHGSENSFGSDNSFNRTAFNIEKRPKLRRSHKVKYADFVCQSVSKESHQQKLAQGEQNLQVGETVLANADTSTNLDHSPETITKVRSEMGPPLPPLLGPLLETPPKSIHPLSPILSSSSCSSLPSPLNDFISPLPDTPLIRPVSPLSDGRRQKSPVLTTTSPAERANRRILSSPLQFCAATPKHALPVPGRFPLSASSSSSTTVQENSVKILDTMYPELSALARTLNILKGNVQLNRGLPTDDKNVSVSQITGFKPITSTSTAFIKTGGNSKSDNRKDKLSSCEIHQQPSSIGSPSKRTTDACLMPRSAKRLRLDTECPAIESMKNCTKNYTEVEKSESCHNIICEQLPDVKDSSVDEDVIIKALKKTEDLCFDLLPVIKSHISVGTVPKVPVMRNEEKEVIYEFSNSKKSLADKFLQVVLKKIKTGKRSMTEAYLQALCRVYVGLCRQLGDIERARILCYSILVEDFPDPDRLLLFIVSSWNNIISTHGVVSKAVQAVLKNLAKEDVGSCLSAYLNWEKTPPMNITVLLSSILMAVQLCPDGKFQQSKTYGEDLTDSIWEYVFAVDLLCSHRKWVWTHDKIISKELWPLLDKWVKRKKGNPNVSFVSDLIAATVLRLVGHLCRMGLKEGFVAAVKNIGAVIIAFLQHANEEGMSWGVQLACVYMLFDLAPSDPAAVYKTLQAWKQTAKNDIPPAVVSCMQELESMCGLRT